MNYCVIPHAGPKWGCNSEYIQSRLIAKAYGKYLIPNVLHWWYDRFATSHIVWDLPYETCTRLCYALFSLDYQLHLVHVIYPLTWASCQIREIAGCACAGNTGKVFSPPLRVSDPDMHHGTCVTHVPWCMTGSLTSGFFWSRWRGKRSRHSRRIRNPRFYVSGKRPIVLCDLVRIVDMRLSWCMWSNPGPLFTKRTDVFP